MVNYIGYVNQQEVKGALGIKGGVNPIATRGERRENYARSLEIRELQQFVNRYTWENLPAGMNAKLMERILYYRGRLVAFKLGDKFYTLPFALNGTIDVYGRYMTVTPLTFNGSVLVDEKGGKSMGDGEFIMGAELNPAYDPIEIEGKDCVILNDYTQGLVEYILPRAQLNQCYNKDLADIIVLIRHNLIASARIYSVRVLDEGQKSAVYEEWNKLEDAILDESKRIFAITSQANLDELFKDKTLETQNYWECFVSLDNLRENKIGIENNGIFKKKERVLKGEQELEAGSADLVYEDGLSQRQWFCLCFNAVFGTDIWCRESDVINNVQEGEHQEEEEVENAKKI